MKSFGSISEFTNFLGTVVAANASTGRKAALEAMARTITAECKRVIGTYELGWQQLAEATQEERARLGYPATNRYCAKARCAIRSAMRSSNPAS
jgi:hypothetical protein